MRIYFLERKKHQAPENGYLNEERFTERDIAEFAWTCLNLAGAKHAAKEINRWRPPQLAFGVTRTVVGRLLDAGRADEIEELGYWGDRNPYLILGLTAELADSAIIPPKKLLSRTLDRLVSKKKPIPKSDILSDQDVVTPAIISFAEMCTARKLPRRKVLAVLDHYTPAKLDRLILGDYFWNPRRTVFRAIALREVLRGNIKPNIKGVAFTAAKKRYKSPNERGRKP